MKVAGESITFALGDFDLTIDTSALNDTTALLVTEGGEVKYTGTGKFSAIGNSTAVRADGTGSKLTVGYAEATAGGNAAYALNGSKITVQGDAKGYSYGAYANAASVEIAKNAQGKRGGVRAINSGVITVGENAICNSDGDYGAGAEAESGGTITVQGSVTGYSTGVFATGENSTVTVAMDVLTTQIYSTGVSVEYGGYIEVGHDVTSTAGYSTGVISTFGGRAHINGHVSVAISGVQAEGSDSQVTVDKNITVSGDNATGIGIIDTGTVTVGGNVTADEPGSTGIYVGGGTVTVDGNVSASNRGVVVTVKGGDVTIHGTLTVSDLTPIYIEFSGIPKTSEDFTSDPNTDYRIYTDGTSTVRVGNGSATLRECKIGDIYYPTLAEALGKAATGDTITLLQSITHTNPVMVTGESITFALGNFDLTINTSAIDGSTALLVTDGGEVKYTGTGTGKFSVIGNSTAVRADGTDSKLTVGYAETTRGSAYTVQATDGGSATVKGNVLAKEAGASALDAYGGGKITVEGNVTCAGYNSTGIVSTGTSSTIHVTGAITAIAAGTGSTGVNSKTGGEATIIGNIAASQIGIAVSGAGNAGTVTVTGNVSITGTATGSGVIDREGIGAGGGGTVLVNGSVSAAGEGCTGVYANGSTVTVTDDVTSANTGVVSTGGSGLNGVVTIGGELTAGTTYIWVGSTRKTAAEDTKPSDQAGYLKYTDGTHNVYISLVATNA